MKKTLFFLITMLFSGLMNAQDGTVDVNHVLGMGFSPNGPYQIEVFNSKFLLLGAIQTYNGIPVSSVMQIDTNGILDTAFNNKMLSLGPIAINRIATYNNNIMMLWWSTSSGGIVKLNKMDASGNFDPIFIQGNLNGTVEGFSVQPNDGKILISGSFTTYNGTPVPRLIRINNNGTLDTDFINALDPIAFTSFASKIVVLHDGRILVGCGNCSNWNGTTTGKFICLKSNGLLDVDFMINSGTGFDSPPTTMIEQEDGKILAAGHFTMYNGQSCSKLIRLNGNGTKDDDFPAILITPIPVSPPAISLQKDQKILIGVSSNYINGVLVDNLARLNSNGTIDCTFHNLTLLNGTTNGAASAIALNDMNKILCIGSFTSIDGLPRTGYAILNQNTTIAEDDEYSVIAGLGTTINTILLNDTVYSSQANITNATVVQTNSPITGITFNASNATINVAPVVAPGVYIVKYKLCGPSNPSITCLDCDEAQVTINVKAPINIVAVPDVYTSPCLNGVVGSNTLSITANDIFNGNPVNNNLVTITLDNTGGLNGITVNSTGNIIIPPSTPFGTYIINYTIKETANPDNFSSSTVTICISNGLNPGAGANGKVFNIARQADGKIIIVGAFTKYNNISRNRIARLNPDLSLDLTFDANGVGFNNVVRTVAIDSNGKIIVGGDFTATSTGISAKNIAKLRQTTIVTTNGTVDTSFTNNNFFVYPNNSGSNTPTVICLMIDVDNNIYVGGYFHKIGNYNRLHYAKLNSSGVLSMNFTSVLNSVYGVVNDIKFNGSKLVLGGRIATVTTSPNNLVQISAITGALDPNFIQGQVTRGQFDVITSIAVTGGNIYAVGEFGRYNNTAIKNIVKLDGNGNLVPSAVFNPGSSSNELIRCVEVNSLNEIVITGNFTTYTGTSRSRIAKLNPNGTLNMIFNPGLGANDVINKSLTQPDDKIIIGGSFTNYNGSTALFVTRILGSNPSMMGMVNKEKPQAEIIPNITTALTLYPNPTTGMININLSDYENEIFNIIIHNALGQEVYHGKTVKNRENSINISHFQDGSYYITLLNEKRTINKIIIKK